MITTVCKISYGSQTVPPIVPAVQGDTGRAISFEIADFTPPAGATATYFILKPSGEAIYNSATITDNSILCELTAQSLAEAGENRMQVRVLQGEDIVTSFEVILMVRTFLGDDAIESGTEMNIFDQAVEQATEDFQTNAEQIVEEVIESIPADYTELTEEVDELKQDLSDLYQIEKLTIESVGPVSIPIAVSIGDTYRVKNNTSATLSFRYVTADNTILQEKDITANNESDVTSTVNADHIRIYFNGTGTASVESLDKNIPKIISEIDGIEEEIDGIKDALNEISLCDIVLENGGINTSGIEITDSTRLRSADFLNGNFLLDTGSDEIIIHFILYYNKATKQYNNDYVQPESRRYIVGKPDCVSRVVLAKSTLNSTITIEEVKRSIVLEDLYNKSKSGILNYINSVTTDDIIFEQGSIGLNDGSLSNSKTRIRSANKLKGERYLICKEGINVRAVIYYDENDDSWDSSIVINANKVLIQDKTGCYYKISFTKGDGNDNITPNDATTNNYIRQIMNHNYVETSIPDNLYNSIENKRNYVITDDGREVFNTGYFHTGYIPLENNTAISFTNQKLAQDLNGFASMAVFDKNKTFLERYNMPNDVSFIEFRQDAKFAIFNAQNEYSWGKELVINYGKTLNAYTEYHAFRVNDKKFNSSMDTMIPKTEYPSFKIEPKIPNPQIDQQSDNISYSELIGLYDTLAAAHTTYITKSVLGHDESNTYDIPVYVFKTENMVGVENNKPNIFIWAGLHGAEKPAITAMYNFAYNLANNLDDELFSLLHYYSIIHIIPCMNPWGYVNDTRTNSNHVDINRNFAYKWESGDDDPTSDRYHGTSALSEAETQIIINYTEDVNPIVILDFHTWGVSSSIEQLYGENARYCFETSSKESCYQGKQHFNDSFRTYDVMINAAYDAIVNQSRIARQEYNIPLGEKYIGIASSPDNSGTIVNYFGSQGKACCSPEAAYHLTKNQLHDEYLGKANVNWIAEAIRVSLNEFINFPFIK